MEYKNKFCISAFVFGRYEKYIPYYIYSTLRSYPDFFVKIFYDGAINGDILQSLEILKNENYKSFEVIELYDSSFDEYKNYRIRGGGGKTLLRFMFTSEYFKEFEYAYFGDIDILIFPENINMLEFHKNQMNDLRVPFSNKVRKDASGNPVKRLTGLHFIKTKEYFYKMDSLLLNLKNNKKYRDDYFSDIDRDESFLYKINKEIFDFDIEKLVNAKRPFHGLHLGIVRGKTGVNKLTISHNSSLNLEETIIILKEYYSDSLFQKIQKKVFVKELYDINKVLEMPNNINWIIANNRVYLKKQFGKVKIIIKKFLFPS